MVMVLYSFVLTAAAVASAPWWGWKLLRARGYRRWLARRLRPLSPELRAAVRGQRVVWVHAVSVGEVLAATRLVAELEQALGAGWVVVVSATTETGYALARERFGAARVFSFPLDFAWSVRRTLRALTPAALLLMESELWPRVLEECRRRGVPVLVANARVSDRSFRRALRGRRVWGSVLRRVTLFLAQSDDDARRLIALGAAPDAVRVAGNLKYDVRTPKASPMAELIREAAAGRPILVAGSTLEVAQAEEQLVIDAWKGKVRTEHRMLLVLAPRHPDRFGRVYALSSAYHAVQATELASQAGMRRDDLEIIVLNTLGDLAGVYGVASIAFVGGSMVPKGGHNPLEPVQFGVPTVMGTSYENFRDVVDRLEKAGGLVTLPQDDAHYLEGELRALMLQPEYGRAMGERGRQVFDEQQGATARVVAAVVSFVQDAQVRR